MKPRHRLPLILITLLPILLSIDLAESTLFHFRADRQAFISILVLSAVVYGLLYVRCICYTVYLMPRGVQQWTLRIYEPSWFMTPRNPVSWQGILEISFWTVLLLAGQVLASRTIGIEIKHSTTLPLKYQFFFGLVFIIGGGLFQWIVIFVQKLFREIWLDLAKLGQLRERLLIIIATYASAMVIYACIYGLLSTIESKSFSRPLVDFTDALYFSAITIATVGYGDIYPTSAFAKTVVISEILIGILLLGFLLSIVITAKPEASRSKGGQ